MYRFIFALAIALLVAAPAAAEVVGHFRAVGVAEMVETYDEDRVLLQVGQQGGALRGECSNMVVFVCTSGDCEEIHSPVSAACLSVPLGARVEVRGSIDEDGSRTITQLTIR